jgi:hypothetical protein
VVAVSQPPPGITQRIPLSSFIRAEILAKKKKKEAIKLLSYFSIKTF